MNSYLALCTSKQHSAAWKSIGLSFNLLSFALLWKKIRRQNSKHNFSPVFLLVNGSIITEGPTGITVEQGANVTLTCKTSSPSNITWRRYDTDIFSGNDGYEVTNSGIVSTLHLYNMSPSKAGNLTCLIRNGSSITEQSSMAKVFVNCRCILFNPIVHGCP